MAISYGQPDNRTMHFKRKHLGFDLNFYPIGFFRFWWVIQIENEGKLNSKFHSKHYIYVCKKLEDANEKCEKNWKEVEQEVLMEIQAENEYFYHMYFVY